MAREYPEFLFQNCTLSKTKGRFMVHLMSPRAIFLIEELGDEIKIKCIEKFEDAADQVMLNIMNTALELYRANYRVVDELNSNNTFDMMPTGMLLQDAYLSMIKTKGISHLLDTTRAYVSITKADIARGKWPSTDLMQKQLKKTGWVRTSSELWSKERIEFTNGSKIEFPQSNKSGAHGLTTDFLQ